jgi:hypothetical protein
MQVLGPWDARRPGPGACLQRRASHGELASYTSRLVLAALASLSGRQHCCFDYAAASVPPSAALNAYTT